MKTSPLETIGKRILLNMGETSSSPNKNTHILTAAKKSQLHKTETRTITLAAIAGALSALIAAIAAIIAENLYLSGPPETHQTTSYWLLFGGITALAAAIEIAYLYYITLRAVHKIAAICDIPLHTKNNPQFATHLVRAAMELPSPSDADPHVDPHRGYPKWQLILIAIIYKTKIMATNAIFKIGVKKIFLRGAARAYLELIAIPVTAIWNAIVTYWILREARIRAIGPSAIAQTLPELLTDPVIHEPAQRAVACSILATRDLHPNLAQMLNTTRELTKKTIIQNPEDITEFHKSLHPLTTTQKQTTLHILTLATIIDGKTTKKEKQLLQNTAETLKLPTPNHQEIQQSFLHGKGPIKF